MSIIIETHAIQSLGPNNINRDDAGSPKSVRIGGVPRARVSSQCWKRAVRKSMEKILGKEHMGIRTSRVVGHLAAVMAKDTAITDVILSEAPAFSNDEEKEAYILQHTTGIARKLLITAGVLKSDDGKKGKKKDAENADQTDALLLLGEKVYDSLTKQAEIALNSQKPLDEWLKGKEAKKALADIPLNDDAVDVALFGRMAASATQLNVDAACQFAHAVGVNRLDMEDDFYTAVDEVKDTSGAGMMGDIEFNSSTLYRYANVDATKLNEKLANPDLTARATAAFVRSFAYSLPTGKLTTFANTTLPNYLIVTIRNGSQPVNLVDAFDRPIGDTPIAQHAAEALARKEAAYENAWDVKPDRSWLVAVDPAGTELTGVFGEPVTFPKLFEELTDTMKDMIQ